jgi:fibro-slime domain-containing protein
MRSRALVVCLLPVLACGGDDDGRGDAGSATAVTSATSPTSSPPATTDGSSSEPTGGGASTTEAADVTTDADSGAPGSTSTGLITTFFTTGDSADVTGFGTGGADCDQILKATIRDFRVDHPDFEDYTGDTAFKGLVLPDLGPDQNPVHAAAGGTAQTTGPAEFAQWYSDVPNVNIPVTIDLELLEAGPGLYSYQSSAFFPIDGYGWDNEGNDHNFHFTTEIHTTFAYNGGEEFTFTGDDDLWMFINGKLALDLGGTHPELSETADLDALAASLGIIPGNSYSMDIFHAERHTDQSNFRIDTSIQCFSVPG